MTVARLLADLRARGVAIVPDGDTLRCRPRSLLTTGDLADLRTYKADVLRYLRHTSRDSHNAQEACGADPDEGHRRIYTAQELIELIRLGHLVGDDDIAQSDIRAITRLKKAFDAEIQTVEDDDESPEPRPPDRPCRSCHQLRFWRSVHGTVVCDRCHPPATPSLVNEWVDIDTRDASDSLGLPEMSEQERKRRIDRLKDIFDNGESMRVLDLYGTYLKADDLDGREVTCQITAVKVEEVGEGGSQKAVLVFKDKQKKFALNATNARLIAEKHGTESDNWVGKTVVLYPTETQYQGKLVPCIRVRFPDEDDEGEPSF